jgi:arylsulfatase
MSDGHGEDDNSRMRDHAVNRRSILLGGTSLAAASAFISGNPVQVEQAQQLVAPESAKRTSW